MKQLEHAFDNDIPKGANPHGAKISGWDRMPLVKEGILLNVKKALEAAGLSPYDDWRQGSTANPILKRAYLHNPNPPITAMTGVRSGWKNEYYRFTWSDGAKEIIVERFMNDEIIAQNDLPIDEARKLWEELTAHGFERKDS